MTPKLTHLDAAALRVFECKNNPIYRLHLDGFVSSIDGTTATLSELGEEALAEYNREHITIPNSVARLAVEALNYMSARNIIYEYYDAKVQDELESAWRAIEAALEAK